MSRTLQEISRDAADEAVKDMGNAWDMPKDELPEVADAVAVAVGKEWAKYRPQHHDNCLSRSPFVAVHLAEGAGPCTCGLSALLSSSLVVSESPQENEMHDLGAVSATEVDTVSCLVLTSSLLDAGVVKQLCAEANRYLAYLNSAKPLNDEFRMIKARIVTLACKLATEVCDAAE